ncbi:MAG TPA: hypothetical protein VE972_13115 [Conexibacter sp.]|nr:hypothetical protein [Conexibacter sp.]
MSTSSTESDQQQEIGRLRARVAVLEHELLEQAQRTARIVADAQERTYWLDRWHLDLNALMQRRGASEARSLVRLVRGAARAAKRVKRALLRG